MRKKYKATIKRCGNSVPDCIIIFYEKTGYHIGIKNERERLHTDLKKKE